MHLWDRIKKFANRPIGYGTALVILLCTLLMTVLFWKSQTPQMQRYSDLIGALSELKYFDARVDRHLEIAYHLGVVDIASLSLDLAALREIGRSVNDLALEIQITDHALEDSLLSLLEQHLIWRTNRVPRLVQARAQMREHLDSLIQKWLAESAVLPAGEKRLKAIARVDSLLSLRHVQAFSQIPALSLHSSEDSEIFALWEECQGQTRMIREISQPKLQMLADDLIQRCRIQLRAAIAAKAQLHQGFYLLSILFFLIVLVLIVRVQR